MRYSILLLALLASVSQAQKTSDINVFVTATATDQSGFIDTAAKERTDSVADLKKAIKKNVHLVDKAEGADIVLNVLQRGGAYSGQVTATRDILGVHAQQDVVGALYVRMEARYLPNSDSAVGDYILGYVGYSSPGQAFNIWGAAAASVAKQVEQWIKANHASLLALRKK